MAAKKETYTEAMKKLEAIVAKIESREWRTGYRPVGRKSSGGSETHKVLQG